MKHFLTLIFTGALLWADAQTPLIAHKSHAGSAVNFFIDPSSNFGEIKIDFDQGFNHYEYKSFKPLNDSVILMETADFDQKLIRTDTLLNTNKLTSFAFEFNYRDSIQKKELLDIQKRRSEQEEQFLKQQLESQKQLNETAPAKKKKKSYLLFLFGITGGGMLLLKLFSRSKVSTHSVA